MKNKNYKYISPKLWLRRIKFLSHFWDFWTLGGRHIFKRATVVMASAVLFFSGCQSRGNVVRLGFSPNLTHAQALIGITDGLFNEKLIGLCAFEAREFHAGPSIVEALFAKEIDMAYLGPVPAINSFLRSRGEFVIVAGSAQGGAALVISKDSQDTSLTNLAGIKILTPQLGNTQDVTARAYLKSLDQSHGQLVKIVPVSNSDQLTLFRKGEADAAWTVEPWVSRLIIETGAQSLLDEQKIWDDWGYPAYPTTVLVARKSFIKNNPEIFKKIVDAHVEITDWINKNPTEAKRIINQKIGELIGRPLKESVLDRAWSKVKFSTELLPKNFDKSAENIKAIKLTRLENFSLSGLIDDSYLKERWANNQN